MNMGMYTAVWPVFPENAVKVVRILQKIGRLQTGNDSCTQGSCLNVVVAWLGGMDKEIHLVFLPIYMPQHMHQPGFCSTAVQAANYLQNAHAPSICFDLCFNCHRSTVALPISCTQAPMRSAEAAPIMPKRGIKRNEKRTVAAVVDEMTGTCKRKLRAAVLA